MHITKVEKIVKVMDIDPETGVSAWFSVTVIEQRVGFPVRGNGSPYFQSDRGLGKKYVIEKQFEGNKLAHVRTTGFACYHTTNRASNIPKAVRAWRASGQPCVMCGTTANVVIDHKDGNKQPMASPGEDDFQVLCQHCNTVKREACRRCIQTKDRFNATTLGYPVPWTCGGKKYSPMFPRCAGCYWYAPREFRAKLHVKPEHKMCEEKDPIR